MGQECSHIQWCAQGFGVLCAILHIFVAPRQGLHVGPGLIGFKSPGLEVAKEVAQALHHKVLKGPVIWVYMLKATEPAERPCAIVRISCSY